MSALYGMRISAGGNSGLAAMYIGKDIFLGADQTGVRYKGRYTVQNDKLQCTGTVAVLAGATSLSGKQFTEAAEYPLTAELSANFADGSTQIINVAGTVAQATFEKIGDIP